MSGSRIIVLYSRAIRGNNNLIKKPHSTQDFIYTVAQELNSSLDLNAVFRRVLALAQTQLGADRASLLLLDDDAQPEDLLVSLGEGSLYHDAPEAYSLYAEGLAGTVARTREAVLITDSSQDTRWMSRPDDRESATGAKSAIVAPLITAGKLIGVMSLVAPGVNRFNKSEFDLALLIASMSANAVRNARLFHQLTDSQKRYKDLFDHSKNLLFVTNLHGKILMLNQTASVALKSGLTREELPNLFEVLALDGKRIPDLTTLVPFEIVHLEGVLKSGQEDALSVEGYVKKVHEKGGDLLNWEFNDISDRKELDAMKKDLASMVYHDLRSPLANILSSLEMVETDLTPDESEKYAAMLEIATRATRRVESLVNSLLDVYKLEAGQAPVTKELSKPDLIVHDAVEISRPRASHRGIQLTAFVQDVSGQVSVDRDMIRRVVSNLIENALRFTPNGGNVEAGLIDHDDEVRFYVKDDGSGISDEDKSRIFDKFYQIERSGKRQGLGLGLNFCRIAVTAHGGKIWVEDNRDKGSIFMFSIPKVISCVQSDRAK